MIVKKFTKTLLICVMLVFCLTFCAKTYHTSNNHEDFFQFIMSTYSQRNFSSKPISDDTIKMILDAGHKAGSAGNGQPWHFTVVQNKDLIDIIMPNVDKENVIILISAPSGDIEPRFSMDFDCALAAQNMFLTAQSLGLGARMYIRPVQNVNENLLSLLELPNENLRVKIILRIGYEQEGVDATTAASPRHPIENKVNFIR